MSAPRPDIQWHGSPNYRPQSGIRKEFYVIHWMVGNLAGTDSAFSRASFGVATNYGIENGSIHQYVADGDYAFGTGNTYANSRGISVEHAGGWLLPDGSRMKPTPATHESSARLLAYLADLYGWGRLQVGVNVFGHNTWVSTECPGSTDMAWIASRAQTIRDGKNPTKVGDDDMTLLFTINDPRANIGDKRYNGDILKFTDGKVQYIKNSTQTDALEKAGAGDDIGNLDKLAEVIVAFMGPGVPLDDVMRTKDAPNQTILSPWRKGGSSVEIDDATADRIASRVKVPALTDDDRAAIAAEVIRQQKLPGN